MCCIKEKKKKSFKKFKHHRLPCLSFVVLKKRYLNLGAHLTHPEAPHLNP